MASNPLVQAVEHFSLQQLMADPSLCRNVLNDMGAQPAEVFLLVAALEARVPHTLMEHSATDDLSVVEPRLVAELNQRGIEQTRAEWAVNAWKDVVEHSTLGQKTVIRPADTVVVAAPPVAANPPVVADPARRATTVPLRRAGRRRLGIIIAAAVAVLVVAGGVVWLTRPSSKHGKAGSTSSGSKTTTPSNPSGSASGSLAPAANLTAPLGPPKNVPVTATVAWTDTGLTVTKGERANITATGQIGYGPGVLCGPDGKVGPFDPRSIIGGGQHHAALIGLIAGSGEPFLVGANYNSVAPAAGRLYLGINDVGLGNNSGEYIATVRLQQY
jgi:hypothetical protein